MYATLTSVSRVYQCGQTDNTKLTVTFHNIADAPKNMYRQTYDNDLIRSKMEPRRPYALDLEVSLL
jgi:hypothetical protein